MARRVCADESSRPTKAVPAPGAIWKGLCLRSWLDGRGGSSVGAGRGSLRAPSLGPVEDGGAGRLLKPGGNQLTICRHVCLN